MSSWPEGGEVAEAYAEKPKTYDGTVEFFGFVFTRELWETHKQACKEMVLNRFLM